MSLNLSVTTSVRGRYHKSDDDDGGGGGGHPLGSPYELLRALPAPE